MACCGSDSEEENRDRDSTTERKCTDVFWLCVYIAFWLLMVSEINKIISKYIRHL